MALLEPVEPVGRRTCLLFPGTVCLSGFNLSVVIKNSHVSPDVCVKNGV